MEWDELRRKCYARDDYKCQICGSGGRVHAHHLSYERRGTPEELDDLQTLCGICHAMVHGYLAHTFWLLAAVLHQLGVEFAVLDEEGEYIGFDASKLVGHRFRFKRVDFNIEDLERGKSFSSQVVLPVALLDEAGDVQRSLADGLLERIVPVFERHIVERL